MLPVGEAATAVTWLFYIEWSKIDVISAMRDCGTVVPCLTTRMSGLSVETCEDGSNPVRGYEVADGAGQRSSGQLLQASVLADFESVSLKVNGDRAAQDHGDSPYARREGLQGLLRPVAKVVPAFQAVT